MGNILTYYLLCSVHNLLFKHAHHASQRNMLMYVVLIPLGCEGVIIIYLLFIIIVIYQLLFIVGIMYSILTHTMTFIYTYLQFT
jgi:hypothetical protein